MHLQKVPNLTKRKDWQKLLLIAGILLVVFVFGAEVFTTSNSINYTNPKADFDQIPLPSNGLTQRFFADEAVRSIELALYKDPELDLEQATVVAQLSNHRSGQILGTVETNVVFKNNAAKLALEFPDTESLFFNEYILKIEPISPVQGLLVNINTGKYEEKLEINDDTQDGRLIFTVKYANNLLLAFFAVIFVLLALSLFILFFPEKVRLRPQELFFILALLGGIAMTLTVPTGQEPDGGDHILRAFDVSYGNISPIYKRTDDGFVQFPENFSIFNDTVLRPELNQGMSRIKEMLDQSFSADMGPNTAYRYKEQYSSITYMPQAFGLYLGRTWSLNAFSTLALARMLNLLAYIILTYQAIRIIPVYKNLMMVIALLPLSVFLASSLSSDSMINGLSFLYIAMIIKLLTSQTTIRPRLLILPAILVYIVFIAKPAYIFLFLFLLVIPYSRYPQRTRNIMTLLTGLTGAAIILALFWGFGTGRLMLNEGHVAYPDQLTYVLHNILPTARTFIHTMEYNAYQYMTWFNYLGWLSYSLGPLIFIMPTFVVLVAFLDQDGQLHLTPLQKGIVLATAVLTTASIVVGLYTFDDVNDIGGAIMLGAQSRYFIPYLILPFLLVRHRLIKLNEILITEKIAGFCGVFLAYSGYVLVRLIY
jgi:uncharacterized membrane protein